MFKVFFLFFFVSPQTFFWAWLKQYSASRKFIIHEEFGLACTQ